MTTEFEPIEHSSRHCIRPRGGLFGSMIRRGPRYNEDYIQVTRNAHHRASFYIYYRVYNPSFLHSESPPLLVVHGGPSLPSDYLYPLVHQMPTNRSIIFYDQLGCGKSTSCQADDEHLYSIKDSVEDLEKLIASLRLTKFHLLGHSFGGILAYEYIKSTLAQSSSSTPSQCMSLILANAPCNMRICLKESSRLQEEITTELSHDLPDVEDSSAKEVSFMKSIKETLRKRHECRTQVTPEPLANAIEHRGRSSSWSGPEAVGDYVASMPHPMSPTSCVHPLNINMMPSVLLIRGEFDFITEICITGWRSIFADGLKSSGMAYREEVMKNCAHYCHLEDEQSFAELVKSHCFINDY